MPCLVFLNMLMYRFHNIFVRNAACFSALDDECQGDFSRALVDNADYCAVGDVGMVEEMSLQFCWRDLVTLKQLVRVDEQM